MKLLRLFRPAQPGGPVSWMIVGLGNPGRKYAGNRHNVGFQVLDRLAAANHLEFDEIRNKAQLARGQIEGVKVALVKPQGYMNLSGEAAGPVARFFKVEPERVLLVFDDLDLPLGTLRLRERGGAGGHRGLKSVTQHLGTQAFPRIRIGIGRPPGRMPAEAYVLQDFKPGEQEAMEAAYDQAIQAINLILTEGFQLAMNRFN